MIARVITPIIFQPDVTETDRGWFGLGDVQPTFFFTPAKPSKAIWGWRASPTFADGYKSQPGKRKGSAGPSVLALVQPGKFTVGALVSNLWSFAGSSSRADVNTMSLQYFVNYNLQKGWSLSTGPIISANWNASSGNVWLVPFGGGFGRIFVIGHQPVNGSVSAYYNAVRPNTLPSPTWQLRV